MHYVNTPASIMELLNATAATSSKKEKEALVKHGLSLPIFRAAVQMAYSPLITFGVRDYPDFDGVHTNCFTISDAEPLELLDALANRRITGDEAIAAIKTMHGNLDADSAQLFKRIILKDMRAGFSDGTINKGEKGLIPTFPYMRCSLPKDTDLDAWPWDAGVFSQEKADGMFVNIDISAAQASLRSRQGQPLPYAPFEALHLAIEEVLEDESQNHGELLVYFEGKPLPREQNNGVLNHLVNGGALEPGQEVRVFIWDSIPLEAVARGVYETPYRERLVRLAQTLKGRRSHLVNLIQTKLVFTRDAAWSHYRAMLAEGKEGTIIKHPQAIWKDGTSKQQIKLKLEVDVDLEVVEVVPGKKNTKNEGRPGSLTMCTSDGALLVDVTVKNEKMRAALEARPELWTNQVMKVRANSIMMPTEPGKPASLYLPRFVEDVWRVDKTVGDTFHEVCSQFDNAVNSA
jgi:DNA ligase 1